MTCIREDCDKVAAKGRQGRCSTHYWRDYRASRREELSANYKAWAKRRGSRWARMDEAEKTSYRVWHAAARARENEVEVFEFTARDHSRLYRRQRGKCAYCRGGKGTLQMDHVIPLLLGGRHSVGNIVLACADCNKSKAAMTHMQWRMVKEKGRIGVPDVPRDPDWGEEF